MLNSKKLFRIGATFTLIAVMLFLAARVLDFRTFANTLQEARWEFLIPSTLLNVLTVGFIVQRWKTLLNHRVPFLDCLTANQIGAHVNILLPLRMGDFTRSYLIRHRHPELSMVAVLSSIGAELTFDMLVLMLLLAVLLLVLPLPPLLTSAGALLAVLTAVAAVSIFSLARTDWLVQKILRPILPARLAALVLGLVSRVQDGLSSLRSNRQIIILLGLTGCGYAMQVFSNWLLLMVFMDDVPLYAGLVALVGAGVGLALPLLPGSAGTYELAVTLALSSIDIAPEAAAAFALVLHGQQVVMTIIMGSIFMLHEGISMRELRDAAQQTPL